VAAAGTRQYTAIFAIGGKMLASFRGVMNAASARLSKLRTSTLAFGKSILKLTGLMGGLGAVVAGFGISKILGGLFEGATEQAKEARQRINATIASFLQLRAVQKGGGFDFAKKQLDIIYEQNEALGKQGVLHSDIYNEMTKQLAAGGVPPRQIKAAMEAMGDLLVKTRGVNATEQEGAEFANAYVKAIHGKTKALQAFGIYIDANKIDASGKKVKKDFQEIYEEVLRIMQGYKGFNKQMADTPEGHIQILQNRLQDIREQIGYKMLPVQAKLADAWLAALTPENVQLMQDAIEWLITKLTALVGYFRDDFIPAWRDFFKTSGLAWDQLSDKLKAFDDWLRPFVESFKKNFVQAWKDLGHNLYEFFIEPINKGIESVKTLIDWIKKIPGFKGAQAAGTTYGETVSTGQGVTRAAGAAAATAAAQAASAQMPLTPEGLKAVQAERASVIADLQRPELRNLVSATLATEARGAEDQKNVLESLVNRAVAKQRAGTYTGIEDMIKGGFYGPYNRGETAAVMSKGLSDPRSTQVRDMIQEVAQGRNALGGLTDQGMINEIKGAIKEQHGEDFYGLQGAAGETQSAAYKYSRAYQHGGIATRPQLATLAERGPELVVPQSKWGGIGATNVSFAPNITINGNASADEQKALDTRLRNLAREFIENFKRAQSQERRLSYESGYG
jgi:hypothetical protein